jgi:biotin transport system substrate-specific component
MYIAMCVSLLSLCAWITIPFTVSFTMQLFAVFWIAAVSHWKQSLTAISLYLVLGCLGLPIFGGFQGGISVLFHTTGGYLIGFFFSTLIISLSVRRFGKRTSVLTIAMLLSLLICYLFGVLWYILLYTTATSSVSVFSALCICVFPFVIPDIFKILLAIILTKKLELYVLRFKL